MSTNMVVGGCVNSGGSEAATWGPSMTRKIMDD